MILAATIWEPVGVACVLLVGLGGGLRWLVERLDRRFDELRGQLNRIDDRYENLDRRLDTVERRTGIANGAPWA
jgi:hypothetical protein